ncbi:UNVERIFIED_CONTAM: hypothetical protein Sindi_0733700 [Sesamum indicum]
MANEKRCEIMDFGDISLTFKDGYKLILKNVRYVPDLSHTLISCAALEEEGLEERWENGQMKIMKGSLVVFKAEKKRNLYLCSVTYDSLATTVNEYDVRSLVLPFTPTDVKQAIFDIAEDKAPGPDEYSSDFFKAAWPIVGQEVSSAVLDFFNTGRFLKQINTILLALIPKDTVEWDFLIAVMELFEFPYTFVKWIETCVTTPSFSIGLNGKPHGFFRGARGLRQGDPLSPYLFVLVMEVLHLGFLQLINQDELFSFHWKCDAARIFQLGFADDLLLFCRVDMDSIGVFKTGLDRFAE